MLFSLVFLLYLNRGGVSCIYLVSFFSLVKTISMLESNYILQRTKILHAVFEVVNAIRKAD